MLNAIITLTTDFGLKDPYVAEMKAVILGINPDAKIVDISHNIEKFNIRMGAYVLAAAAQHFPKNTIHLAVVDPGVGTKRKAILIETEKAYFVGPDNGILALAAEKQGLKRVHKLSNRKFMLPEISATFHGRDIFAPAAAFLSKGVSPSEFGPVIRRIVKPKFAEVTRKNNILIGEVIHVDDFGNIITNITSKDLEELRLKLAKNVKLKLKDAWLKVRLCSAYAEAKAKTPIGIIGSHDFLEISINMGNAAEIFQVKTGDKVTVYRY
ncbi:MAG: S-adenosyl-l-methionine hydroxide adenosyltransferase family protein [Candidatus Bathyarchaeia archaeon]